MLKIKLDGDDSTYQPGAVLSGQIIWEFDKPPRKLAAYLAWSTEGKGDEDGDYAIEQNWTTNAAAGSQAFKWTLPRGPISLNGTLIRLQWTVEGCAEKPDDECSVPTVISHLKRPIILTKQA